MRAFEFGRRYTAKSTDVEVMLLTVFGDESTDEREERVFAIAGIVGREMDWREAEVEWLRLTEGEVFSAAKCELEKKFDLYRELTQVLIKSRLGGYGAALDLISYKKWLPESRADIGYYICFMRVVRWLTENAANRFVEPIEFSFHHRKKSDYSAGKLYDILVNMPEWEESLFMKDKVLFTSDASPRIQMADLLARETMKSLDNQILGLRPRKSMQALCSSRFRIDILGDSYCAGWRNAIDNSPHLVEKLSIWLAEHKLADNMSNRIRFMEVLNESKKS